MEALNGMTLLETLFDETAPDMDMEELDAELLFDQRDEQEESKDEVNGPRVFSQEEKEILIRNNSLKLRRRTSIRTPAVVGLKNKLNQMKKTFFEENEAKPLIRQMLTAILKMHRLGIVHRDLNPGNIFLHFADLPTDQSPNNV